MRTSIFRAAAGVDPFTVIDPLVASSNPAVNRSSVDFPQPDGPTSDTNSPGEICSETSLSDGGADPNAIPTRSATINGVSAAGNVTGRRLKLKSSVWRAKYGKKTRLRKARGHAGNREIVQH
jgi:hypothetical protein